MIHENIVLPRTGVTITTYLNETHAVEPGRKFPLVLICPARMLSTTWKPCCTRPIKNTGMAYRNIFRPTGPWHISIFRLPIATPLSAIYCRLKTPPTSCLMFLRKQYPSQRHTRCLLEGQEAPWSCRIKISFAACLHNSAFYVWIIAHVSPRRNRSPSNVRKL